MTPDKQHHYVENMQQIAAKDVVALPTGVGVGGYAFLSEAATIAEQVGMICGGLLSFLILVNWVYVHIIKRKKEKKS